MYIFLIIIHVIASLVLIAVILLQAGKGGSLAETFGGGAAQNLFGTSASKILTKATTVCAVTFILTSISLSVLSGRKSESLMRHVSSPAPVSGRQAMPASTTPKATTNTAATSEAKQTAPAQNPAVPAK